MRGRSGGAWRSVLSLVLVGLRGGSEGVVPGTYPTRILGEFWESIAVCVVEVEVEVE